jgi:hypothetical protein
LALGTHANAAELQQLSSFYRLLGQASASRSEREIMRVFVEALAVWQDAESWAYYADVTSRFVLDVTLPGSDRSRVPSTIDHARITVETSVPSRPEIDDLEAIKFPTTSALLMSRIRVRGSSDWLIFTENPGDPDSETRLGVYVQAVVQALSEVNAIHSSRLTWAMLEHLLPAAESLVHPAQGAIDELASSVDAAAWFHVFASDGMPVLAAGDLMSVLSRPSPARTPSLLVLPVEVAPPYQAAIGMRRSSERPLAGRDEQLLRMAASTMGTWLSAVVDRLPTERQRRTANRQRSFDQILKRRIDDAMVRGEQISIIVIALGPEHDKPEVAHECVGQIRRQLRPADMAGRLSSGQIGVVLQDTPPEDARFVVERLRRLLTADGVIGSSRTTVALARLPGVNVDRFPGDDTMAPNLDL